MILLFWTWEDGNNTTWNSFKNIFYFNSSRFLECNGLSGKPLLYLRHVSFPNFTFNSIKTCVTHFAILYPRCCWWEEPEDSPAVLLTILKYKSPPYLQHPTDRNNWFMLLQSQVWAQRKNMILPSRARALHIVATGSHSSSCTPGTWEGVTALNQMLWLVQHDLGTEQSVSATVPPATASTKLTHEDLLLANQPSQNCSDIMISRSSHSSGKHIDYHR